MKIYIGYDSREDEAWDICKFSIMQRASLPLEIEPLNSDHPKYSREYLTDSQGQRVDVIDGRPFSTSFSFARFMVPAIQDYKGWAVYADCDFLFLEDIAKLWQFKDDSYAIRVVKHEHDPIERVKMDGRTQQTYPRKNWSSLVLWNCGHPANRRLTPYQVNSRPGSWLHGFHWLQDEEIGELPLGWNYLSGYYPLREKNEVQAIHYTEGGPWFDKYRGCDFADLWLEERESFAKQEKRYATAG